jgi:pilus assembly protein FimV
MVKFLSLCLWQVIIIGTLTTNVSVAAEDKLGISIRGPKLQDQNISLQYGPISPSDTLWNIALNVRLDPSLSVYQVMQSLYLNNPQAFAEDNINYLVEGEIINIPSVETMRAINGNSAKLKADIDERKWISKVSPPVKKSLKKTDIDKAKIEINEQLRSFGESQKLQLDTIQKDLSDSIAAMQTLLKENEDLRTRLVKVDGKVEDLQDAAAQSEETNQQLNEIIIILEDALELTKTDKKNEILKNEQAELQRQSFISSPVYTALLMTVPAILLLGLFFLYYIRLSKNQPIQSNEPNALMTEKSADDKITPEQELDQSSYIDEKSSLDDELLIAPNDNDSDLDDSDLDESDLDDIDLDDLDIIDDELPTTAVDEGSLDPLLSSLDHEEPNREENQETLVDTGKIEQSNLEKSSDKSVETIDIEDDLPLDELPADNEVTDPDAVDALLAKEKFTDDLPAETTEADELDNVLADDLPTEFTEADDFDDLLAENIIDELPADNEVTDPDAVDAVDALLAKEKFTDDLPTEITEVDDLDNLLAENVIDELPADNEVTDPDAVDALLAKEKSTDDLPTEITEADDIIDELPTDDEVTDPDVVDVLLAAETLADDLSSELTEADEQFNEDELDIDQLIPKVNDEQLSDDTYLDIGDDLLADIKSVNDNVIDTIDDETMEAISSDFDESTLSDLLNDEKESNGLSAVYDNEEVPDTSEIEDIQNLDNLDFDELLANIEEESEVSTSVDLLDIKDELTVKDVPLEAEEKNDSNEEFVSVDSLLSDISDNLDNNTVDENYDKDNIDVGLDDFPEFTANDDVDIDVDDDELGLAAKLDLAKVYIEIGDVDNAEVILNDIVNLGDEKQRVIAQNLLDKMNP